MTAPRRHLLPPNATTLEKAVDQTAPNWDATAQAFPLPRQGTPEAVKPWLAAELQLAPFARYFATTDELLAAGGAWLLMRGTAAAVLLALLLDYAATVLQRSPVQRRERRVPERL